jgi:hypothetical protein
VPAVLSESDPFYKPYVTAHGDSLLLEIWKDVPDWSGYQVSTFGRVRSCRQKCTGKLMDTYHILPMHKRQSTGYLLVTLCDSVRGIRSKQFKVHRLVLLTFIGPDVSKPYCLHNNGIKDDNRLVNLRWGTPKDNWEDSKRQGVIKYGRQAKASKYTEAQLENVRYLRREQGLGLRQIAAVTGISRTHVKRILSGHVN